MVLASSIYIYIRVYVDSHSLGQLALASKRTASLLLNLRSPRDYVVRSSVRPSRRSFPPVVCVR